MATETLTIVLKADGTGLTGTLRTAGGQVQQFGAVLDATSGKVTATGAASRRTARDVDTVAASARHATGSAREWATSLNTLRGTLAALGVTLVAREIMGAGLAVDRFNMQLTAATGSQQQAGREMAFLREQAYRLGIYLPSMVQGYAGLSAATRGTILEGQQTREIFLGVAEAARVMNLDTAATQGVFTALQQIAGKGTVSMEELRQQLGDRMPGAMQLAADAMGMTVAQFTKAVSEGNILSADLLPKLAERMRDFASASLEAARNTPAAQMERLKTALFEAAAVLARGGLLQLIGKSAGEAADAIKRMVDSGAVQRFGSAIGTAFKITAAWFALYRGVPAVVLGLKAIRDAYIGISLAQTLGIQNSGLFSKAAISGLQGIKTAAGGLFAAFAGWQIGSWLSENFVEARYAGILFVEAMLVAWATLKQATLITWELIKAGFIGTINVMRSALSSFVGAYADAARMIPDMLGGDATEARLRGLADALAPTTSASEGLAAAMGKINQEASAARAEATAWSTAAIREEQSKERLRKVTEATTEATTEQANATQTATTLTDAQVAALRRLIQAREEFARENQRMEANLAGPEATIWWEYADAVREANAAQREGAALAVDVRRRVELLAQARDRALDALREEQDVMGRLRATMQEEIDLSKLSTEQRRIEEMVLRTLADAKQQNVTVSKEEARAVVAAADAQIRANEDHIRSLEDLQQAGVGAFQSMAQAMGDFVGRGFRGVKDMWSQIKDAFKRGVSDVVAIMLNASFVRPLQNWLGQMLGLGGSQGIAGMAGGQGGLGAIMNNGFDRLLSGITGIFSRGGSAAQAMQTATEAGWQMAKAAGVAVVPVGQAGGMMLPNGSLLGGGGSIFGGLSGMLGPLLGVGLGASMGGDTLGKIGGGLTGGALAYSMLMSGGGLAGLSAGMASGGLFGGLSGMAGAMGPIGWAALGAMAINSITGGKLFGTSYKAESASQQWSVSEAGASGSQSVTEVKQQSFFRGRKWRTTTSALDAEAMAAVNELFLTLEKTVQTAAQQLGIDVPDIVGGSFKREFDKNGNLTREFGTIAGRVYNEAQDAFAARLVGENMLAVAKAAGSSAELEQLAEAYRGTGEELQSFATLALAVQEDLRSANGIWKSADGDGVMTKIVEYIEGIAKAGESLADAYARVQQTITQYGDLIGGVRTQLATRGLNQYQKAQLDVELAYRAQVKQANELAKALGLSGARAEDLAAIEQLRALNMADLAQQYAKNQADQNKQWLAELGLSDLSPLRDDQKLAEGMNLLREAVGAGDAQRAQKLAEQVLGLGRNLYASGADYAALYNQVTGLVGNLPAQSMEELQGLTNEQLATLADLVGGLPEAIAQELAALLVAPPPVTTEPQLPPAPTPQPPPPSGGGGGGGYDPGDRCVAAHMVMDDGTLAEHADAGNVHATHDPAEGFMRHAIRARGEAVWQPCVRLVTADGAALVCSASTPFTAPDAPADLPEYTTLAPDMLGREVIVERAGLRLVERVVDVQDVGMHLVIPLDFGGRSFPAGEDAGALIYSHNMQKVPDYNNGFTAQSAGIMSPEMASTFGGIDDSLKRIAEGVESQNRKLDGLTLEDLNGGPRVPWKNAPRTGGVYY